MKKLRRTAAYLLCAVLFSALCACSRNSDSGANTENDIKKPDTDNAAVITLSDDFASITGNGVKKEDGVITITKGGTYVVSGTINNGRIIVNAPKEEVVIVLENANITCSYGSPVYVYKSSVTTVYLSDGTTNTLTDGSSYTFNDSLSSGADEEPNACLYSKSDLVIAGSGSLTVNAGYKNGITSKDTLKIDSTSVSVTAPANGINGKDSLTIKNASVNVKAGDDALRSTNDTDASLGYIVISDSALNLTAGEDGIQAETGITISGGSCVIKSGGGSGSKISSDASAKGIKAGSSIVLNDGAYTFDCCDDAVHSNGSVEVNGGSCSVSTGDDGIHADGNVKITSGTINIAKSYEGIEGETIDITGGTIEIVSSDDGLNAAGGADQSGFKGMYRDRFGSSANAGINISGGHITVDASGDGIDSNGKLNISGGEIYVSGPTGNNNSALDYDGSAVITGGLIVAAGSSGMAQNFGTDSTQGSILLAYSSFSNEKISVTDSSGNILAEYAPDKNYNCVVVSCPALIQGNTYTVNACGQKTVVTLDSLIYGNSYGMKGFGSMGGFPGDGNNDGRPNDNGSMGGWPKDGNNTDRQPAEDKKIRDRIMN